MSDKKTRRKPKTGDEQAREIVKHFAQYDDFSKSFLDNLPHSLPRKLRLKIGPENVGTAVIDWKAVMTKFIGVAASMAATKSVSADEQIQRLIDAMQTMSPEEKAELMLPAYAFLLHMAEFLPQKLNDAMMQLAIESRHNLVIRNQQKLGAKKMPSVAEFAAWVAKFEEEATKKRLPEIRGGSEPDVEVSDEQCTMLSADYPALLLHWRNIKKWHKELSNWREHAKVDFPDTPDELLDKLSSLDSYERQPSTLAHEHAARRCGIPANKCSLSTLSRHRRRGDKIRGQSKS